MHNCPSREQFKAQRISHLGFMTEIGCPDGHNGPKSGMIDYKSPAGLRSDASHVTPELGGRYDDHFSGSFYDPAVQDGICQSIAAAHSSFLEPIHFNAVMSHLSHLLIPFQRCLPFPYPVFNEYEFFQLCQSVLESCPNSDPHMQAVLCILRVLTWSTDWCQFFERDFGVIPVLVGLANKSAPYARDLCSVFVNLAAEPTSGCHRFTKIYRFACRLAADPALRTSALPLLDNLVRYHAVAKASTRRKILDAICASTSKAADDFLNHRRICASILRGLVRRNSLNLKRFVKTGLATFVRTNLSKFPDELIEVVGHILENSEDLETFNAIISIGLLDLMVYLENEIEAIRTDRPTNMIALLCWVIAKFFRIEPALAGAEEVAWLFRYVFEVENKLAYEAKNKMYLMFCSIFRGFPVSEINSDIFNLAIEIVDEVLRMGFDPWLTIECQFPLMAIAKAISWSDPRMAVVAELGERLVAICTENGMGEAMATLIEELGIDGAEM
jgi:hypothetical protein